MAEKLSLNKKLISSYLSEQALQVLAELHVLESTSSTNDQVMKCLQQEAARFIACVANMQTEGRGRNGKSWQSPSDANIYLSVGGCFGSSLIADISGLSLACGVAVAKLMESMGLKVGVKWPNDILFDKKKLAGILVETRIQAKQILVVVGIGLNIKMPVIDADKIDQPWVDLSTAFAGQALTLDRNYLTAQLMSSLIDCLLKYNKSGFKLFENDWKSFDILTGQDVLIKTDKEELKARVVGLNEDFALRVEINNQEEIFYAADIKLKLNDNARN